MHELSVAISLVDTVKAVLEEEGGGHVASVSIAVGAHAGVVVDALTYAWGPASSGTALAKARLDIEEVPAIAWCEACEAEVELPGLRLICPGCGASLPELLSGRELDLLSVEIEAASPVV